jgi:uncharacterized BrkB/YihY/UPF0761 family membrane protein
MSEHDVRTYARAIAFQVLTSLIPLALLVRAAAGFLEVEELWTEDLAPEFEAQVSEEVYAVADEVVRRTLGDEQPFWLTVGLVFTLWQTSGGRGRSWACSRMSTTTARTARSSAATRPPSHSAARSRS